MNLNQLPVNWFDIVVLVVLLVGMSRGRKRGMSQEWLVTVQWLVVVGVAPYLYRPLGDLLAKTSPSNRVLCYVAVYLASAVVIKIIFGFVKKALPEKFSGASDAFGSAEYYLGMLAGMVRFACILVAFLALLNAPYYSAQDLAAAKAFDEKNYGSSFFPRLSSIQQDIFQHSLTGGAIHKNAEVLLIAKNEDRPKRKKDNLR